MSKIKPKIKQSVDIRIGDIIFLFFHKSSAQLKTDSAQIFTMFKIHTFLLAEFLRLT